MLFCRNGESAHNNVLNTGNNSLYLTYECVSEAFVSYYQTLRDGAWSCMNGGNGMCESRKKKKFRVVSRVRYYNFKISELKYNIVRVIVRLK